MTVIFQREDWRTNPLCLSDKYIGLNMSSYGTQEASCIVNIFKSSQRTLIDLTNLTTYWNGGFYLAEKKSQTVFSSFSDKASVEAVDTYSQD